MEYGKEIFKQLMAAKMITFAWGCQAFKVFTDKSFSDRVHRGGLLFKVRGLLHKGHVMIRVLPNDLYLVSIGRLCKGTFKVKKEISDVFVEDLHKTIDDMVEGTLGKDPSEVRRIYSEAKVPFLG